MSFADCCTNEPGISNLHELQKYSAQSLQTEPDTRSEQKKDSRTTAGNWRIILTDFETKPKLVHSSAIARDQAQNPTSGNPTVVVSTAASVPRRATEDRRMTPNDRQRWPKQWPDHQVWPPAFSVTSSDLSPCDRGEYQSWPTKQNVNSRKADLLPYLKHIFYCRNGCSKWDRKARKPFWARSSNINTAFADATVHTTKFMQTYW